MGITWKFRKEELPFLVDNSIDQQIFNIHFSRDMRFSTMWYVRRAEPQISLRIRAVWSEHMLVVWIFYQYLATDQTAFWVSKLKRRQHRLVRDYTCQNATLLEITCHGSNFSGDLFDMLLPMLSIYQEYVRNHHYSLQVLAEYKQRQEFNNLLKRYEEKPACENRTLEIFLTYPMHQVGLLFRQSAHGLLVLITFSSNQCSSKQTYKSLSY